MTFDKLELHEVKKEIEAFVEIIRPPKGFRKTLDVAYRIYDQSIEIFMIQPQGNSKTNELIERPTVKICRIREQQEWRVYCMRSTQKWALYEKTKTLVDALNVVRTDQHCCFFG
ncbi:DUF3024 domain-containing protein [Serratia liquefaciens]|uniref:DUF3024 domain-containing protein n=1 Tax=Serratia liquefaciens TaxID=614 RepID=UPI003905B19B